MNRLLLCLLLVCSLGALISCSLVPDAVASGDPGFSKRLFIVLMDETGSFVSYWDEALRYAKLVPARMGEEDAFIMIGIDDRAGDPADVRVPMRTLPPNPIEAIAVRSEIVKEVQAQKVRNPEASRTDVLGAVATAAAVAGRHTEYRTVLVIFSDMDQLPRLPDVHDVAELGIRLRPGTEARVFFFQGADMATRRRIPTARAERILKDCWLRVLAASGVQIGERDFASVIDTEAKFNELLPLAHGH